MTGNDKTKPPCPQGDAFNPPIPTNIEGSPEGFFSAFSILSKQHHGEVIVRACLKLLM